MPTTIVLVYYVDMNTVSRTITGAVIVVIGMSMLVAVTRTDEADTLVGLLASVFFIGVGVYIFFNRHEDDVEEVDSE